MGIPVNNWRCCCGRRPGWILLLVLAVVVVIFCCCLLRRTLGLVNRKRSGSGPKSRKRSASAQPARCVRVCVRALGGCACWVCTCMCVVKGRVGNEVFGVATVVVVRVGRFGSGFCGCLLPSAAARSCVTILLLSSPSGMQPFLCVRVLFWSCGALHFPAFLSEVSVGVVVLPSRSCVLWLSHVLSCVWCGAVACLPVCPPV